MFCLFAFFEQVINKEHPMNQSKIFTAVLGSFSLFSAAAIARPLNVNAADVETISAELLGC